MLYIIGDTHGDWSCLNSTVNKLVQNKDDNIDIIITGDFGYWPKFDDYNIDKIKTFDDRVKYYFCPGNHEDWWSLLNIDTTENKIVEIHKNIFYCSFGAVKVFNGYNFLFCGGADSVDKNQRTLGFDWFPQEVISTKDMYQLPEKAKIDVIISHTCPTFCLNYLKLPWISNMKDCSCDFLQCVHQIYNPKLWFFGHFHKFHTFNSYGTKFVCLDYCRGHSRYLVNFNDYIGD